MKSRITNSQLETLAERINDALGAPQEMYKREADGTLKALAGHVYLAGAYGGVRFEQMCEGGGARDFLPGGGNCTKRELLNLAHAWLAGAEKRGA